MTNIKFVLGSFFLTLAILFSVAASADTLVKKKSQDYFVRFKSGVTQSQAKEILRSHGLQLEWKSTLVPGLVRAKPIHSAHGTDAQTLKSFRGIPEVKYISENTRFFRKITVRPSKAPTVREIHGDVGPSDPMLSRQWALVGEKGVHPQGAWQKTLGSKDIKVAIMDTGIDAKHPELSDRVLPGYDFIEKKAEVRDTHGHGTHVSGIIGAKWDNNQGIAGINRDVSLIPIRVVPDNGDETDANLIEGFEFAVKQGARVANCSFGKNEESPAVGEVIAAAGKKGLLVIVAAGNDGEDNNEHKDFPANFNTPNMIVVASSTSSGRMSGFSNYGMGKVDVAAPGSQILSSVKGGGYASWDGTSMATPQVVGIAALVLAANPSLTVEQVKNIILKTVDVSDEFKGKINTGGIVNATKAVAMAKAFLR